VTMEASVRTATRRRVGSFMVGRARLLSWWCSCNVAGDVLEL
jgi:hypothetical protein